MLKGFEASFLCLTRLALFIRSFCQINQGFLCEIKQLLMFIAAHIIRQRRVLIVHNTSPPRSKYYVFSIMREKLVNYEKSLN